MSLLRERPTMAPTVHESTRSAELPGTASAAFAPHGWIHVTTITHRRVVAASVYDCVRFMLVRHGSVILTVTARPSR